MRGLFSTTRRQLLAYSVAILLFPHGGPAADLHEQSVQAFADGLVDRAIELATQSYNQSLSAHPRDEQKIALAKEYLAGLYHYQGRTLEANRLAERKLMPPSPPAQSDLVAPQASTQMDSRQVQTGNEFAITEIIRDFETALRYKEEEKLRSFFPYPDAPFIQTANLATTDLVKKTVAARHAITALVRQSGPVQKTYQVQTIQVFGGVATMTADYTLERQGNATVRGKEIWSLLLTRQGWGIVAIVQS